MSNFSYRADIDGLRAVSVILVVLFHTNGLVTGGYVGVDVFFVISGFLITSLVQQEILSGKFSLNNFWVRRIRRILPASVACILGTLCLCSFVMLPEDLVDAGNSAMASSVAMANVFFWRDGGYFAGPSDEKPFLHFWSLAVEEQFYLLYPMLLLGISKVKRLSVFHCLVFLCLISFALSVWGAFHRPSATFYLLPTRAWELLIGGVLATGRVIKIGRCAQELTAAIGLLLILSSAILFTPQTPFPGATALLPCLGAICLIYASSDSQTVVGRVLSSKPFVFVGLISYSLYLWHWPVLALLRYCLVDLNFLNGAIATVVSVSLAILSWRFIEQPFRRSKSTGKATHARWRPFVYGGLGVVSSLLFSCAVRYGDGWIWRYPSDVRVFVEDAMWSGKQMGRPRGSLDFPRIGDLKAEKDSFVVWGDSHAMMMSDALDKAAKSHGISGWFVSVPGVPPLPGVWRGLGVYPPDPEVERVIQTILQNDIPNVILIARWAAYAEGYSDGDLRFEERGKSSNQFIIGDSADDAFSPESGRRVLAQQLLKLVERLVSAQRKVWIVQQVPEQSGPTAWPLLMEKHLGISASFFPTTLEKHTRRQSATNSILYSTESVGAKVLATQRLFFDECSNPILLINGRACYRDSDHLTKYGANVMLKDIFENMACSVARQHTEPLKSDEPKAR